MKTCVVYHRVDWDGFTAAAVAKMAFPDAELIGWTYGDPVPYVASFDRIIVVDLSLPEDWMIANASKLVWIDHHKNTIETLEQNKVLWAASGIRRDGIGACALAWQYFFPGEAYPGHVRYVATADVMDYDGKLSTLKKSLAYMLYLDTFGPGCVNPVGDVSKYHVAQAIRLFNDDECTKGFSIGYDLECDRAKHEQTLFENAIRCGIGKSPFTACVLHIDGRPNACILTHLLNGTDDVFVCIGDKVGDKYKISLRVPRNGIFDASEFCRRFGGNGHIKAAGCLMSSNEILEKFGLLVG